MQKIDLPTKTSLLYNSTMEIFSERSKGDCLILISINEALPST